MAYMSVAEIARAVSAGERTAVEVLDEHLARIDPELNAIVLPRFDAARREAQAGRAGPLAGVPFTCKDPFPVEGLRSPNGSKLLADYEPGYTCEPVRRLQAAGALLIGKTNVSEFSMHWDSTNPLFGSTLNPADRTRTAGGSSGGEACAVASGISAFGLGSDLGGSIRNPAHFCGIYGLRTGRGTMPGAAHHPMPASPGGRLMGTLGPLTRTLDDLELVLSVLAPQAPPPWPVQTVAVFEDDDLQPVAQVCREAVRAAAAALDVVEARPPGQATARRLFDAILGEELGGLPAFVGDRDAELAPYNRGAVAYARSFAPSIERYLAAFDALAALEAEVGAWLGEHPVMLCPVAPDVAPPVGLSDWPDVDGVPPNPGGMLSLCTYASVLGLPALAVPVSRTPDGLPVGVQLIGAPGSERTLIALARRLPVPEAPRSGSRGSAA
jgi:Asp-tRNA(Asn)/Glu-tRNA(Gln) amidotransferase A subunit family amidase